MTPIERVKRRAEAAARLNVSIYSTPEELKKEWRRRVYETHPDRNGGCDRDFKDMQVAFDILARTAGDDVRMPGSVPETVRPRRVVSRTVSRTQRPVY